MLELDLIGNAVTLTDGATRLLLAAAEADSGSSVGSRDLATRLRSLGNPAIPARRRRLVFTRPESRALQRTIQRRIEPTGELDDLRTTLSDVLSR